MILPFSTHINGQPNFFVAKIWKGLRDIIYIDDKCYSAYFNHHIKKFSKSWDFPHFEENDGIKIHTIREDKSDRWKEGNKIHFFINNQKPDMFKFAPVLQVMSVQEIYIIWEDGVPMVWVDGKPLWDCDVYKLSKNDGFDSVEDFFAYFNKDFKGKIIHWTSFKY